MKNIKLKKSIGLILLMLATLIPWLVYIIFFKSHVISNSTSDWSDFGSYIGGTVAALTIPITLYLLIGTYKSQKELERISLETLNYQKFERRFFELIKVFNDFRTEHFKIVSNSETHVGYSAFIQARKGVSALNKHKNIEIKNAYIEIVDLIDLSFEFYFRSLENILITLEEIDNDSKHDKEKLLKLLINSLSNDEKYFIKHFDYIERFKSFEYLKKYKEEITKDMIIKHESSEEVNNSIDDIVNTEI